MSLISQNAILKEPAKKKKRVAKKDDIALAVEEDEDVENGKITDVDDTRSQKRKRGRKEKDEKSEIEEEKEMKKLENFLFASLHTPFGFGKDDEEEVEEEATGEVLDDGSALFFTDKSANSALSVYEEDFDSVDETIKQDKEKERKPVWVDDEEEKANVNIAKVNKLRKLRKEEGESVISGAAYVARLRAQHIKMNRGTDWARPDARLRDYSSDDEDSDKEIGAVVADGYDDPKDVNDILKVNEDLVRKRGAKLLPGILECSRLADANMKNPSNAPVNSVQFHKNGQLLLVGGLDRSLRFFQVDGKKNDMIQSIFLEDCPIRKASFVPDGSQVIISGRRKFP